MRILSWSEREQSLGQGWSMVSEMDYLNGALCHPFVIWSQASCCCCSVASSHLTLCYPMDCSTTGFPVLHHLPKFHVHWVGDAIQPSHPLSSPLLLPSIFPSIRVFSSESALCKRSFVLELQLPHRVLQSHLFQPSWSHISDFWHDMHKSQNWHPVPNFQMLPSFIPWL